MKDPRYNNPEMLKENRFKLMVVRHVKEQRQDVSNARFFEDRREPDYHATRKPN